MNKEFDFDKIGKRMPYTTPDGFFDELEEDIWQEVKNDCQEARNAKTVAMVPEALGRKSAKLRLLMRSAIAVAASIVLVFVVQMNFHRPNTASVTDVDQAFSQLSSDDQAYLLDIYQDDVFINE